MKKPVRIIVPAHTDHIYWLAKNMRDADRDEVAASHGLGPYCALWKSLQESVKAWTGLVNDEPICMFGVSALNIIEGIGSPWLLGTPEIEKNSISFLKLNRCYVRRMLELFPRLVNYVDARNKASIRWLRWMGFRLNDQPVAYGLWNMPFFRFEMERRC